MKRLLAAAGLLAVALAAVAYAYASSGSGSGSSGSGIFGSALLGGPCPVSLELQTSCRNHPVRATIAVMRGGSRPKRVATLRSGGAGRFRIALAPGKYRLVPRPVGSAYAAPRDVRVPDGSFVQVNVRYRASNR
jgi:hypothetical protein